MKVFLIYLLELCFIIGCMGSWRDNFSQVNEVAMENGFTRLVSREAREVYVDLRLIGINKNVPCLCGKENNVPVNSNFTLGGSFLRYERLVHEKRKKSIAIYYKSKDSDQEGNVTIACQCPDKLDIKVDPLNTYLRDAIGFTVFKANHKSKDASIGFRYTCFGQKDENTVLKCNCDKSKKEPLNIKEIFGESFYELSSILSPEGKEKVNISYKCRETQGTAVVECKCNQDKSLRSKISGFLKKRKEKRKKNEKKSY